MNDKLCYYLDEKYKKCTVPNFFGSELDDVLKSKTGKNLISDLFLFCLSMEGLHPFELLIKHKYLIKPVEDSDFIPEDLEIPVLKRQ